MPVMKIDRTVNLQAAHSAMRKKIWCDRRCCETERTRNVSKFDCKTSPEETLVGLVMWMRELISVLMIEKKLWCCDEEKISGCSLAEGPQF